MSGIEITVVPDEGCPRCGAEGRPKVGDENGDWWWKCYTPGCTVGYWLPETGEVEERASDEELRAMAERIKAQQAEFDRTHEYVRTDDGSVPDYECWEPRLREGLPGE